jgi:hypothetical protein
MLITCSGFLPKLKSARQRVPLLAAPCRRDPWIEAALPRMRCRGALTTDPAAARSVWAACMLQPRVSWRSSVLVHLNMVVGAVVYRNRDISGGWARRIEFGAIGGLGWQGRHGVGTRFLPSYPHRLRSEDTSLC